MSAADFDPARDTVVLERTPRVLDALLRGLPDALARADEGSETFSPLEVVAHLVHGEREDWIPRARILLAHGTARAFAPFDRFAQRAGLADLRLDDALDEFARLRADNLAALAALDTSPRSLARRGLHPELGEVTLGELLATWVVHDLAHLAQIARVLARRHREHAGPWAAYIRLLRD